ncbi:phosphonate metabolism transcriptional regulator PhnF [uncultured Desulfuromusa sp.]|uniref:phosphonate metabolism transcriptional regulator PhnF n=1 Tax=uncultured Desulfuromusa sp. TaxID=219183 RepID=UPI002AA8FC17|nr:phosphonate metabolism transcriptional regulator PhnF [uncultured Desulfuromusa sp.]
MQQKSQIARYQQISRVLVDQIVAGLYPSGSRLPSEQALSLQFEVNRHTVREALRELKNEGSIYSVRGKGHFVTANKIIYPLSDKVRFTQNILEANLCPGAKLLHVTTQEASVEIGTKLKLKADEAVLRLEILRTVNNVPFSVASSYLPAARFQGLDQLISGSFSLYALLKKHFQVEPLRQESLIETCLPDSREMQLLQVSARHPLLVIRSTACDKNLCPVEYVVTRTRGDLGCLAIHFNNSGSQPECQER